jgi:POT family proton-dependent oligopeptide transporter
MMVGVNSINVFFASVISGRIGGLYEQVSASTFWLIHAGIVAGGGVALLARAGPLRRLLSAGIGAPKG